MFSHAHIYGIDLASPAELIAHEKGQNRAVSEIARHIGADRVIFQDLEDLKAACFDAVISPTVPALPRDFEVGVFCGTYMTPVDDRYLKHLLEVRGAAKKMKVLGRAREAVAKGVASQKEIHMTARGAEVKEGGGIVPAVSDNSEAESGVKCNGREKRRRLLGEEENIPARMDISLHNFADFADDGM